MPSPTSGELLNATAYNNATDDIALRPHPEQDLRGVISALSQRLQKISTHLDATGEVIALLINLRDEDLGKSFSEILDLVETSRHTLEQRIGALYLFSYCPTKLHGHKDRYYELLRHLRQRGQAYLSQLPPDDEAVAALNRRLTKLIFPLSTFLVIEGRNSSSPPPSPSRHSRRSERDEIQMPPPDFDVMERPMSTGSPGRKIGIAIANSLMKPQYHSHKTRARLISPPSRSGAAYHRASTPSPLHRAHGRGSARRYMRDEDEDEDDEDGHSDDSDDSDTDEEVEKEDEEEEQLGFTRRLRRISQMDVTEESNESAEENKSTDLAAGPPRFRKFGQLWKR